MDAFNFNKFGYIWTATKETAPGTTNGLFDPANVVVGVNSVILKLNQTKKRKIITSSGGQIQSQQLFSYGTFRFRLNISKSISGTISAGFLYQTGSVTEIDVEQQGNLPGRYDFTNWINEINNDTSHVDGYNDLSYDFCIGWAKDSVVWEINGLSIATHIQKIPSAPAYFLFNFWGTNSPGWGGLATLNTPRTLEISNFSFLPVV
jgi:hypothetical protein